MNRKITVPLLVLVAALIILPTFTPEDLVTVVPIIGVIGVEGYALLCLGFIGLLYVTGMLNRLAQMLHVPPAVFAVAAGVFVLIAVMGVNS